MNTEDSIFVAGHRGLVGSAIVRALERAGFKHLLLRDRKELDLTNQLAVETFFKSERPRYVFLAAAKVGGILANDTYPADFLRDNLAVQTNVIDAAYRHGAAKLLFLGSSCVYPKHAPQPMQEDYLMTGFLEPTNEPYAIAKIAGIKMCQAFHRQFGTRFISVMPTNLYGPGDNYHLQNAHVLPALIRKFHEAKLGNLPSVTIWGTGSPRREFLHVDDLADACIFLMEKYDSPEIINVGTGVDLSIRELAYLIKKEVGYEGEIVFDSTYPDGTPKKQLDTTKINGLGWSPRITLEQGVRQVVKDYSKASRGIEVAA